MGTGREARLRRPMSAEASALPCSLRSRRRPRAADSCSHLRCSFPCR